MTSRDRVARHRAAQRDGRIRVERARWDEKLRRWESGMVVQPWPHTGSEQRYNAGRCQCGGCLEAHRVYTNQNRALRRVGPLTTDSIPLDALRSMALQRPPTVPPPPHPVTPPPGARRGRHRSNHRSA